MKSFVELSLKYVGQMGGHLSLLSESAVLSEFLMIDISLSFTFSFLDIFAFPHII